MTRRRRSAEAPVTYGAIGATQAADLLYYPPQGYRPMEASARLGSGRERFEAARAQLMSWGVQRGAGLEVRDIDPGTGEQYAGIRYGDDGQPLGLRELDGEAVYDENGELLVANGMTAVLRLRIGPFHVDAPVRVVYVIDEPEVAGFAYGTLPGHPESGEEAFLLQHRPDDTVWLVVRAFSRPANGFYALVRPIGRALQRSATKRYLRALHPAGGA